LSLVAYDDWGFRFFNIFFTLSFGVLLILIYSMRWKDNVVRIIICCFATLIIFVVSLILPFDYGMAGILLIILFWIILKSGKYFENLLLRKSLHIIGALLLFNIAFALWYWTDTGLQWWSLSSVLFILAFNDKKVIISKYEKWAFYVFYPLHLVILYLVAMI